MNKQTNLKIADILDRMDIGKIIFERSISPFSDIFRLVVDMHPEQRAGQLICNYICSDYRSANPCETTREIMETLFPGDYDPFFEESAITLKRLSEN